MTDFDQTPGALNPGTGEALPKAPETLTADVQAAVDAARAAQPEWAATPFKERARLSIRMAELLLERREELIDVLQNETGRSRAECLMTEVAVAKIYVKKIIKIAKKALRTEKVIISPLELPGKKAFIEAIPRGVIGIIAPWNYPIGNFAKSLYPALLAGNGLVLKPSEHTPRCAEWMVNLMQSHLPEGLVSAVYGAGDVGQALIDAGVNGVVFTGSVATGKKVMAYCGERLIPCSVELGGNDAAIVLRDCNMDRTVIGIAQWAFHNAGQNCGGIERVFVEEAVADTFVRRLGEVADKLKVSPGDGPCDLGPLQNLQQLAIVERHVEDAVAKGAELVAGGKRVGDGFGFRPTVLDKCTPEMDTVSEETFGPVVAITRVKDAEEAVKRANDSHYGLNGSVWTTDLARGQTLARQLEVGVCLVNNHSITGSMPNLPWTGVKDTGPGIASSKYAYGTFVRRRVVFIDRFKKPDPFWFPIDQDTQALGDALVAQQRGSFAAIFRLLGIVGRRFKAIKRLSG